MSIFSNPLVNGLVVTAATAAVSTAGGDWEALPESVQSFFEPMAKGIGDIGGKINEIPGIDALYEKFNVDPEMRNHITAAASAGLVTVIGSAGIKMMSGSAGDDRQSPGNIPNVVQHVGPEILGG